MNPVYGVGKSRVLSCFSRCPVRDTKDNKDDFLPEAVGLRHV